MPSKEVKFEIHGSSVEIQLLDLLAQVVDWSFNANPEMTHEKMQAMIGWFYSTYHGHYFTRMASNRGIARARTSPSIPDYAFSSAAATISPEVAEGSN
jgi:hypothetical protein